MVNAKEHRAQAFMELDARRKLHRIGIQELCDQAGIPASTYWRWRRRERCPRPEGLAKVSATCERLISSLLTALRTP